ncbi:MAG: gliding motility protein GldM [Cyclobacteriaceae bacterium]|jgi:gliding motility-associated protein GldM|nr:gliding motility protein GldM [Flammeovirgaceae bacterium]
MAGGKETPRQKMIGMMYLVLTALLALNVSNAVLEKFAIIDETLITLIREGGEKNENKLKAVLGSTSTEPKVLEAKAKAQKVRDLTKEAVAYLDDLKAKMKVEADGKVIPAEELVLNTNRAEELMLDHRKPEVGQGYEKKLNEYVTKLNEIMGPEQGKFAKLTKGPTEYEAFKNSEHHKGKTFLQFSFEGTPTMGAIATISQMQTEILEYEGAALDSLNAVAEGVQIKFDKVFPMVRPNANIVIAGLDYEADLLISAAASGIEPEMFFNGGPVKVETNANGVKVGKIKFKASGGDYKNGVVEKSYNVKINIKGKPYEDVVKYKVAQPVAKFESESASTLYLDCGNEMTVSIAGLTESSGISLSAPADQGKIIQQGAGKFVIIPTRPQINVAVRMDGVTIDTKQFKAKPVPTPIGKMQVGNGEYDVKRGIPPGTSIVKIVPSITDDTFARNNAKDAGYRITSMTMQVTGKTPINITSGTIELSKYGLRPGDTFSISNVQVVRSTWDPSDADNKPVNAKIEGFYRMGTN